MGREDDVGVGLVIRRYLQGSQQELGGDCALLVGVLCHGGQVEDLCQLVIVDAHDRHAFGRLEAGSA